MDGDKSGLETVHELMCLFSTKRQTCRRLTGGDHVTRSMDSLSAGVTRKSRDSTAVTTTTTTRPAAAARRSFDVQSASNTTYVVSSSASSPSTPRTYVVHVLTETDDESSCQTSPRIADRLARRCRRRRPQSLDGGQHSRLPVPQDGGPELGYSSHQSTSTETFFHSKSVSSESLRRRRRRPAATSPGATAGVMAASAPNLPTALRPSRTRRSSVSSEDEIVVPSGHAEPVDVRAVPSGGDDAVTKSSVVVSDGRRASRLPRLVALPADSLPSTSSVSATTLRAPRPRSFRYSRLHRRAVDALVPPTLRDMPCRWALKANTDVN